MKSDRPCLAVKKHAHAAFNVTEPNDPSSLRADSHHAALAEFTEPNTVPTLTAVSLPCNRETVPQKCFHILTTA